MGEFLFAPESVTSLAKDSDAATNPYVDKKSAPLR